MSEIAIFAGLVAIIVWLVRGGTATLVVGLAVTALGVVEFTAREHFSGYRSHTSLLAAIPSLAVGIGVISAVGDKADRGPLLLAVSGSLFALLFWFLRRRFQIARQARVVRSPLAREVVPAAHVIAPGRAPAVARRRARPRARRRGWWVTRAATG